MSSEPNSDNNSSHRSLALGRMTAEGASALLVGEIISKLVGIVGSIVLIRLLVNPAIYAPIAAATTLPGLVMIGDITGVSPALTRTLSLSKREGNPENIWSSYWVAITIKLLTGSALSLIAFGLGQPIAFLLGKQSVEGYLLIASSLPLVWTVQVIIKSTLLSLRRARAYSWLQIVNEILLSFAPIPVVLLGYGAVGALIAMVLANFAYLVIGLAVSTSVVFSETDTKNRKIAFIPTAKKLVKFGLPLGLSGGIGTFISQINNFIILRFTSLFVYGLYSVATSATSLLNSINDPLKSMTYPVYSRIKGSDEVEILQTVYKQSVRYSTLIILPFSLFFIIFGRPFMMLFFGNSYASGGIYLSALSLGWLTIGMGWTANVLTSQGYSKYTGAMTALSNVIGAVITIVAVPTVGLLRYLLIFNLAVMPSYILMIRKTKAVLSISTPYSYVRPFYIALLLSVAVSIPVLLLNLSPLIEVIAGSLVVEVSFLFFSILVRGLTPRDPENIGNMLSSQPKVHKLSRPIISILSKSIVLIQRRKVDD